MGGYDTLKGHLHSGHGVTAASASIPTKYQTTVISNSEDRKGFTSKAKRFIENWEDTPGPGCYHNLPKNNFSTNGSNPMSKKGTGSFASKSRRMPRFKVNSAPAPNTYTLSGKLASKKDFNCSLTAAFHSPIAKEVKQSVYRRPAPNQYKSMEASKYVSHRNVVSAEAAFKSGVKRTVELQNVGSNLSPAKYNIKNNPKRNAITSCFRSKTERKLDTMAMKIGKGTPGPGAYKPEQKVTIEKTEQFPRRHFLTISAPAMPMPPTPPLPGPGSYELVDYKGPQKRFMSSAAFVSGTSRWIRGKNGDGPGPGDYEPRHPLKKVSYIYNTSAKWIPG